MMRNKWEKLYNIYSHAVSAFMREISSMFCDGIRSQVKREMCELTLCFNDLSAVTEHVLQDIFIHTWAEYCKDSNTK